MKINMKHFLRVLPALTLVGAVACGDDDTSDGNGTDSGMDTTGPGMGMGMGMDTGMDTGMDMGMGMDGTDCFGQAPDGDMSFQAQHMRAGNICTVDPAGFMLDPDTLAVTVDASPTETLPGVFDDADYFGAVDPTAAEPFWAGWTAINSDFDGNLPGDDFHPLEAEITGGTISPAAMNACTTVNPDFTDGGTVDVFGATFPVCVISQTILQDTTLPNNHVFVLSTTVEVGDGGGEGVAPTVNPTLTIDAGTQIYASTEQGGAILAITRGADIDANGTADQPIIMGAVAYTDADGITDDPADLTGRGDWGGLAIDGFARTNPGTDVASEASDPNQPRFYGGMDDSDDSGEVEYVIIAETGFAFTEGAEIQGLTAEAIGSGTLLDHIQVIGSDDDCVEFFGGTADISHLICNAQNDDGLDLDEGYRGNMQFAIVRIGDENGERGIESDNNSTFDAMPQSAPVIANLTVLGNPGRGDAQSQGALHREGIEPQVWRSVFSDDTANGGAFEDGCIDVDDTFEDGLRHLDVIYNCSGGAGAGLAASDD